MRPTLTPISSSLRRRLARAKLVRDRPARIFAGAAEPLLQREFVDLDDDAVDLVVERRRARAPTRSTNAITLVDRRRARDVRVRSRKPSVAQDTRATRTASPEGRRRSHFADRVGEERQRAARAVSRGSSWRIAAGGRVARVGEQRLAGGFASRVERVEVAACESTPRRARRCAAIGRSAASASGIERIVRRFAVTSSPVAAVAARAAARRTHRPRSAARSRGRRSSARRYRRRRSAPASLRTRSSNARSSSSSNALASESIGLRVRIRRERRARPRRRPAASASRACAARDARPRARSARAAAASYSASADLRIVEDVVAVVRVVELRRAERLRAQRRAAPAAWARRLGSRSRRDRRSPRRGPNALLERVLQHAHAGRARVGDERVDVLDVEARAAASPGRTTSVSLSGCRPSRWPLAEVEIDPVRGRVGRRSCSASTSR